MKGMHRGSLAALAIAVMAGPAYAEVSEDRVKALEARLAQLEADGATREKQASAALDKLKVNGFMSAGTSRIDGRAFTAEGVERQWTHDVDSVIGLQVDGQVNDKTHAVLQLVSRGQEDFDVKSEWAYIGIHPTPDDEIRVGKQRYPFFGMSEYLEVGYAYPWARPPLEVYQPTMPSNYDGVSFKHAMTTGSWSHEAQAFWGSTSFSTSGGTFDLRNSSGLAWESHSGDLTFTATYSQGDATFTQPFFDALASIPGTGVQALRNDQATFGGLGMQYDNGDLVVMLEATRIRVPGFFADTDHAFATVGYRVGKFMPHVTWATTNTVDTEDRQDNPALSAMCGSMGVCLDAAGTIPLPVDTLARMIESDQDSVTLGVRYDFLPNAALKVDWTHVTDTHGTFGYFSRADQNTFYGAFPDDPDIYRVVVDVVF